MADGSDGVPPSGWSHSGPATGHSPFLTSLAERARAIDARIALPESDDPRTLDAVALLVGSGLAQPVLIGAEDRIRAALSERRVDLAAVEVRDPSREGGTLASRLESVGVDLSRVDPNRFAEPLWFGVALVALGEAAGCVAGAVHATPEVIRAALRVVGKADGIGTVSSAFYMDLPQRPEGDAAGTPLTFTDAGVVPDPTPGQLAEIAAAAVRARRRIVGDEPRVAFLSYSTHGSADGPRVRKVREGVERFRALMPDVVADGELQADAALLAEVRQRKAPDSPLTEGANILVFPDLDAGNIAYKLVQRLTGATALGPVLQGLSRPVHDLSRGATAGDIVLVSCIAAVESVS